MTRIEDKQVQLRIDEDDSTADVKRLFSEAFDTLEEELDLIDWKGLRLTTDYFQGGRLVTIEVRGITDED